MSYDCVVIGAGVAGMTTAIYLKRANVNVLVIEKSAPGGTLNSVSKIENYPGFKSITGPDLAYNIYEQLQNLNIEIRYGKVLNIDNHVITTDIEKIEAKTIVIATGRMQKQLNGLNNFSNISYCALCDGNLYKDKVIAIIGNKETDINEIKYLSELASKVYLLTKDDINQMRDNIEVIPNCVIKTLSGNKHVETIITNKGEFKVDGMFVLLGSEPQVDFLDKIEKENNYIIVDSNMKTSIDYIYACGDIIKKNVYQITTAVGEAATAAIEIKKELNK